MHLMVSKIFPLQPCHSLTAQNKIFFNIFVTSGLRPGCGRNQRPSTLPLNQYDSEKQKLSYEMVGIVSSQK